MATALQTQLEVQTQSKLKNRRNGSRAKIAQTIMIWPEESSLAYEICDTENVSRDGLYFLTSALHYFVGMPIRVTRNFRPGDPMNREEHGDVFRVDRKNYGQFGVAIRIFRSRPPVNF